MGKQISVTPELLADIVKYAVSDKKTDDISIYNDVGGEEDRFHINIMKSAMENSKNLFEKVTEREEEKQASRKAVVKLLCIILSVSLIFVFVMVLFNVFNVGIHTESAIIIAVLSYCVSNVLGLLYVFMKYITSEQLVHAYISITEPLLKFSQSYMEKRRDWEHKEE